MLKRQANHLEENMALKFRKTTQELPITKQNLRQILNTKDGRQKLFTAFNKS